MVNPSDNSEGQFEREDSTLQDGSGALNLLPDPGFLWQIFVRNLSLFATVVAAIIGLTVLYLLTATPFYRAQSSILVEPSADVVASKQAGRANQVVNADEVDTEIRLISSPLIMERAAEMYADRFASPDGDRFSDAEQASLAKQLAASTLVTRSGQTRVIDIIAEAPDPGLAAAAANLVAEAYLSTQVDAKTDLNESSREFVNARLEELERNAIMAQTAVDMYRAERGLASANGSTNAEMEVSNLNQQLASARAELAEKRGRYAAAREQLSKGSAGADVGAALGSGTISSLRQQEATVSAELAILRVKYGALHPERRQAEQELQDIQSRIQDEINRVLSNLQAEVQTAQSRVASLEGSRGSALGTLRSNSVAQTGLSELEQKADAARTVYEAFLERSQETNALRDSATPDAVLYAKATVPTAPSSPNFPLTIIAGTFLAMVAGFGAIMVAEYVRRGVQTKRDVERKLRLRYAGAIPSLSSTLKGRKTLEPPHDYVINHPHSLFAEAFRSVRTFLTMSPGKRARAIAITSALPGEGKTTTAVCLARTTAAEGLNILLLDADLRRRGSSELLEYKSPKDIYDFFNGSAELHECIYIDPMTNLHVLGSNSVPDGPSNPLTSERVAQIYDHLRRNYEVIIVDTAPILGVAESRILAAMADRVLLITHWKKTSVRAVEAAAAMLIQAKAKVTGLALTQVNIKKYASTGDGDVYAYSKKFRGYYQD